MSYLFTSESVSEGHPDKVCDQISDRIADLFYEKNGREARIAVETLATTQKVVLAGEVRGDVTKNKMIDAARDVVKRIGYEQEGFHWKTMDVECLVHEQSGDIAKGVDDGVDSAGNKVKAEGAGDQGIMFGYACDETAELMPAPIVLAHKILRYLADARHGGEVRLLPDAKSQVTLCYKEGKPVHVDTVLVSHQHVEGLSSNDVKSIVQPYVEKALSEAGWSLPQKDKFIVNPTGQFVIGGPDGDAGLTGRKIIVDTYGGAARHGGGAFSGKDCTKVDRSAAYAARYIAKNIVAAGFAKRCEIQLSYAIGVTRPLSIYVNTFGTSRVDEARLGEAINEVADFSPAGIRGMLDLAKPIYERTAAYGHFGRTPEADGGFSWERLDLVESIKAALT